MRPEEEEALEPPHSVQYRSLLLGIIESELLDVEAASCALRRCKQFDTYSGLQSLIDATQIELQVAKETEMKRYLFAYLQQLMRVKDRIECREPQKIH